MNGSTKVNKKLILLLLTFIIQNIILIILALTMPKNDSIYITNITLSLINLTAAIPYFFLTEKYSTAYILNTLDIIFVLLNINSDKTFGCILILSFIRLLTNGQLLLDKDKTKIEYPLTNKYLYYSLKLTMAILALLPLYLGFIYNVYYFLLYIGYLLLIMIYYLITNEVIYKGLYKKVIIKNEKIEKKKDIEEETESLIDLLNCYYNLYNGKYLDAIKDFSNVRDIKDYELDLYFKLDIIIHFHLENNKLDELITKQKEIIKNIKRTRREKIKKRYEHFLNLLELTKQNKLEDLEKEINIKKDYTDKLFIGLIKEGNGISNILKKYLINNR